MNKGELDRLVQSIPLEGSIDLLALGHIGLILWRMRKEKEATSKPQSKNNNEQIKYDNKKE